MNLANCELFIIIFLTNIHRYTKNVYGICTGGSLFTKLFLTNSFYLYIYGFSKNFPAKIFLCTVACIYIHNYLLHLEIIFAITELITCRFAQNVCFSESLYFLDSQWVIWARCADLVPNLTYKFTSTDI